MFGLMMGAFLFSASAPPQDAEERRERLKDPANVWPMFQEHLRRGEYSKAHSLITPSAAAAHLPYEVFYIIFASFEAPRRMVAKMQAHKVEGGATPGRLLLCSPEFGVSREVKLTKFMGKVWTLDFARDDVEYFKGRPMDWYRHQVKRADGRHFAYPPDWTYAPLARTCSCGK